jgi:hypothetical protein
MSLITIKEFLRGRFPALTFHNFARTEDDDDEVVVWTAKAIDPLTGERGWVTILEHWPEGATIDWT